MELIDRADLLAEIQLAIEDSGCVNHERDIMDCIRYAPTIDAEPVVHARWMHDPHDISTFYAGDCSNCGCAPKRRTMSFKPWNYCPNCGARMDADAPPRATDHFVDANKKEADAPERAEGGGAE